jgi:hypothetical protein
MGFTSQQLVQDRRNMGFDRCPLWVILDRLSRLNRPADFRFAPKATEMLHSHEMTRCASKRHRGLGRHPMQVPLSR